MAEFRKYIYALAVVALLAGLTAPVSAQVSMTCTATATVPPSLRAEGMTELAGDIIIDCVGGSPTAAGTPVPQVNIVVSTNVALTSKITGIVNGVNFSEAIIIVDQPNTTTWSAAAPTFGGARNILNCGSAGAPDTNAATGLGICQILATASPWTTYDGTPLGQPVGTCAAGALTYGCGRPNVFQGRQDLFSAFPQQRIQFLDVPIDPPGFSGPGTPGVTIPPNCDAGGACHRILRITNIRVNAANLGGASGSLVSGQPVFADLTVNPTSNLPLVNVASLTIGRVNTSLATPVGGTPNLTLVGCLNTSAPGGSVTFAELVPDAWKARNISLLLDNNIGVGANPLYNLNAGVAAGTAAAVYTSGDCRQNVPGANYETEAGFQNTAAGDATACPAGIPNPNPPSGIGFGAVPVPPNNTAFSDRATGTNIQAAGVATSGTRLMVNIQNVFGAPGVVTVSVPSQVLLKNRGTGAPSGVAILQAYGTPCTPNPPGDNAFCPANTGFPAGGPANQVTISTFSQGLCLSNVTAGTTVPGSVCSAGRAFYEVVFSDPGVAEQMTIPFTVSFTASVLSLQPPVSPAPVAVANGQMGYAPHYPLSAPQSFATPASLPPTATAFPYPRFVDNAAGPFPLFSISGKCTCNLLFPYVTDATILSGSSFDTGIAIANTSRDPGSVARTAGLAGSFGFNVGAQEQQGPVQFWYYSTQQTSSSPNFGNLGNGAQGNTQCTNVATPGQCNDLNGLLTLNTGTNVPAGGVLGTSVKNGSGTWGLLGVDAFVAAPEHTFTGYVIAQASFQYCHGVAFITTNALASVAGLNIPSLSYVALTLDNNALSPRTSANGESLGH